MSTGGTVRRWRPVEVGSGLIAGAAVGAVIWGLTALWALGASGYEACESRTGRVPGDTIRADVQWFPLKSLCSTSEQTISLTSAGVTFIWSAAVVVLAAAAATGVALVLYAIVRWLQQRFAT